METNRATSPANPVDVRTILDCRLSQVEAVMRGMPQVECRVEHEFSDGVYIRKMFVPAGTMVMGKRHRLRTYNILLSGEVTVYAGDGQPAKHLVAPATFVSEPLSRKLGLFHQDSVWINVHPTQETDPAKIEAEVIVSDEEYRLLTGCGEKALEARGGDACLG